MQQFCDFHIHSEFSTDSKEAPVNIVNKAISLGIPTICFTDHNDYDYPSETGEVEFALDFPNYIKAIQDLQQQFRDKIDIRIGLEQGLQAYLSERINQCPLDYSFDFIIGSSHLIDGEDPYYDSYWTDVSAKCTIEKYFRSIYENVQVCTGYDVYGHLDYIIRYAPHQEADYNYMDYVDLIDEILKIIISKGKGIEINTAALKYGLSNPHPCPAIITRYKELGGEIITLGSDAHKAEHLAYDFHLLGDILKNSGFKYYSIFKNRKPEFIKID